MRPVVSLLIVGCLAACHAKSTQTERSLVGYDNEWRQRQAILDAEAIMQGMAQARERADQLARTSR